MKTIHVDRIIGASRAVVWSELRQIDRHVKWMADAESITFLSTNTEGVGTEFACRTKVGPIVLNDKMEITAWVDEETMSVIHRGIVTGEGTFTLGDHAEGTLVTWEETLDFPWWVGGPPGAIVARFVLRQIWKGNLRRLASLIESPVK
jgi:hypothetical protein